MIVKYFDKGKGSTGAVEYITEKEDMQVLKGDPSVTAQLIASNKNKLKYRSGVISFGADVVTREQKLEIINEFERNTFSGLSSDEYNILWVQHNDTDNDHIHFVIPRLHLGTMKAFNPHWHKSDQDRLMLFQDYVNNKYNLSNPYDAINRQSLQVNKNWNNRNDAKEKIHVAIVEGIAEGIISNRDELIEFLETNDIPVTKVTKKSISINIGNIGTEQNTRMTGAFYGENYTDTTAITRERAKTEREHRTATEGELRELKQRLERAIATRAAYNKKHYSKHIRKHREQYENRAETQSSRDRDNTRAEHEQDDKQPGRNNRESEECQGDIRGEDDSLRHDNRHDFDCDDNNNIKRNTAQQRQYNNLLHKNIKEKNDSIRATTKRGARRSREEEQETIRELRSTRSRIQKQYTRSINNATKQMRNLYTRNITRADTTTQNHDERESTREHRSISYVRENHTRVYADYRRTERAYEEAEQAYRDADERNQRAERKTRAEFKRTRELTERTREHQNRIREEQNYQSFGNHR